MEADGFIDSVKFRKPCAHQTQWAFGKGQLQAWLTRMSPSLAAKQTVFFCLYTTLADGKCLWTLKSLPTMPEAVSVFPCGAPYLSSEKQRKQSLQYISVVCCPCPSFTKGLLFLDTMSRNSIPLWRTDRLKFQLLFGCTDFELVALTSAQAMRFICIV